MTSGGPPGEPVEPTQDDRGAQPAPASAAYVERARELAERLAARDIGPEDSAAALAAVRDVLELDVDSPTGGHQPAAALKPLVKRLTAWYLAYLAEQVNDLGFALLRVGETLDARAGRGDARAEQLASALAQLEARVRRLEGPGHQAAPGPGPQP